MKPTLAPARPSGRRPDEPRPVRFVRGYTRHAAGSVLAEFGATRVLCTASVAARVPPFRSGQGGWVTAEYGMLPGATHERGEREAARGRQSGRTLEIQRLIGRALRAAVDLTALGERTLTLDCDVLQADGGTRVAAISGAWLALRDALATLCRSGALPSLPLRHQVAAIAVGLYGDLPVLDLDYAEDHAAAADLNVVMTAAGGLIELQGTAERDPFDRAQLHALLDLATAGMETVFAAQRLALAAGDPPPLGDAG